MVKSNKIEKTQKNFKKPLDKSKDKWYNVQAVREKGGAEDDESSENLVLENWTTHHIEIYESERKYKEKVDKKL